MSADERPRVVVIGDAACREVVDALLLRGVDVSVLDSVSEIPHDATVVVGGEDVAAQLSALMMKDTVRKLETDASRLHLADLLPMPPLPAALAGFSRFAAPPKIKVADDSPRNRAERRALVKRMRGGGK